MKTLTIFHDPHCGLCVKFRSWLENQPKRVRVEFLAYDSAAAEQRFPNLAAVGGGREIVVLADDGRWWQGAAAWNTCLWATVAYYEWSFRFSSPALLPLISKVVHLVSDNRLTISHILKLQSEKTIADTIRSLPATDCHNAACLTFSPHPTLP